MADEDKTPIKNQKKVLLPQKTRWRFRLGKIIKMFLAGARCNSRSYCDAIMRAGLPERLMFYDQYQQFLKDNKIVHAKII